MFLYKLLINCMIRLPICFLMGDLIIYLLCAAAFRLARAVEVSL
jgi:hypothetical protein